MKKLLGFLVFILATTNLAIVLASCVKSVPQEPNALAPSTPNPMTEGPGLMGQIPKQADIPPDAVVPNVGSVAGSGNIAGANVEVANLKAVAKAYLAENNVVFRFTSEDLVPSYVSLKVKAKYYFSSTTDLITRVDSVSSGWVDIVFSLHEQKWIKGIPDNNHPNDQDVP